MRNRAWLAALCGGMLIATAGCASHSGNGATLVLNDSVWDRVNVEVVHTTSDDCDDRGRGYISSERFVMRKGMTRSIQAPQDENICWRHDADPNNPSPGAWSGWSKAVLPPGVSQETDL